MVLAFQKEHKIVRIFLKYYLFLHLAFPDEVFLIAGRHCKVEESGKSSSWFDFFCSSYVLGLKLGLYIHFLVHTLSFAKIETNTHQSSLSWLNSLRKETLKFKIVK